MPFALVFVGLILIVSGVKDTHKQLGAQIVGDFTGPGNFIAWIASLGAVGAIGYVPQLRKFSVAFMTLIIIAMVLAQQKNLGGGFFDQFYKALASGPIAPARDNDATGTNPADNMVTGNAQNLAQTVANMHGTAGNNSANDNFDAVSGLFGLGVKSSDLPGRGGQSSPAENFGKVLNIAKWFF